MNSIYFLLIVALVLFSWVGSVYGLMLPDGTLLPNLLSGEGVRWFVRHSMDNVSAAPFAEVLLVLLAVGSLRSSGLWHALWHRASLVQRQRHALLVALVVLAVCACIVLVGIVPGGNLLSVTGHIAGGPFASGWPFLLTLMVVFPCVVYGKMCGQWHTSKELYAGLASSVVSHAGCFITLVVASQLVAAIQYVRLFQLLGLSAAMQAFCFGLIYTIPLIILFVTNTTPHDTSSTE
ncbi:MAG: AbgT family transporter [Bacteroidaceae bacterium]|nr:AbgT family transporter [Bacteroidaceae bacterium]